MHICEFLSSLQGLDFDETPGAVSERTDNKLVVAHADGPASGWWRDSGGVTIALKQRAFNTQRNVVRRDDGASVLSGRIAREPRESDGGDAARRGIQGTSQLGVVGLEA